MKLELSKEWFERNIPREGFEVGACNPTHIPANADASKGEGSPNENQLVKVQKAENESSVQEEHDSRGS